MQKDAAVYLANLIDSRLLNSNIGHNEYLYRKNRIINRSQSLKNAPGYILETDNMGEYMLEEFIWHDGMFCNVFRTVMLGVVFENTTLGITTK